MNQTGNEVGYPQGVCVYVFIKRLSTIEPNQFEGYTIEREAVPPILWARFAHNAP